MGPAGTAEVFGRQREIDLLSSLLERGRTTGGTLILAGEPGVGRSVLLALARRTALAAGFRVLDTTGLLTGETDSPFGGLRRLLRPILGRCTLLPPPQAAALAAAGLESDQMLVALATLNLLVQAAADVPVLLLADDLHRMDRPTRDVIEFVARRVEGDPVVVLGAVRTTGTPSHEPFVHQLDRLDDNAADRLIAAHAADLHPADRALLAREAMGNPLALTELPIAWRAAGALLAPEVVPVTTRLATAFTDAARVLPADTQDALLIAAVADTDSASEILRGTAVLSGLQHGLDVLEPAIAAGLVVADLSRVRFRHPVTRAAIVHQTPPRRVRRAHEVLANLADQPARRIWHLAQAADTPDEALAGQLAATARDSPQRDGSSAAVRRLARAAVLTPDPRRRGHRLLLAAREAFDTGRRDHVEQLLRAAQQTALSGDDRVRAAWTDEIFHDAVPVDGTYVADTCELAHACEQQGSPDLAADLLLAVAMRCWWSDPGQPHRERVADIAADLPGLSSDPRVTATLALTCPVSRGGQVLDVLASTRPTRCAPSDARLLGIAAHTVGDPVRAEELLAVAEAGLRAQGRLGLLPQLLSVRVPVNLALGDVAAAAIAAADARRLAIATGQPSWDLSATVGQAMVSGIRGDADTALALARTAERDADRNQTPVLLAFLHLARGWALMATGAHDEAYHALRLVFAADRTQRRGRVAFATVGYLAEAARLAGQTDDVRGILAQVEVLAESTPAPLLHAELRHARAVLADDQEAAGLFEHALRTDPTGFPLLRARTQLAYGGWLRRRRLTAQSRGLLRSALDAFQLIGVAGYTDRARGELRAAGERRDDVLFDPGTTLSAYELRIARLAATGLTNRDIGERLSLSPRTVGAHLYRIYPKLQITSRRQLATRLGPA